MHARDSRRTRKGFLAPACCALKARAKTRNPTVSGLGLPGSSEEGQPSREQRAMLFKGRVTMSGKPEWDQGDLLVGAQNCISGRI